MHSSPSSSSGARPDRAPPRGDGPAGTSSCSRVLDRKQRLRKSQRKGGEHAKEFHAQVAAAVIAALMVLSAGFRARDRKGHGPWQEERQETREATRDAKQACKAGDEKTRAECRQEKRDTKQEGRQDGGAENTAPATGNVPKQ